MGLINAVEVKTSQMYTEDDIAMKIKAAVALGNMRVFVNSELVNDDLVKDIQDLGYTTYQNAGRMEITWQYAGDV